MTYVEISAVAGVVGTATAVIGFVVRGLNQIRLNDLKHQDEKLDTIVGMLTKTQTSVESVEGKIDRHIEYHLEHKI